MRDKRFVAQHRGGLLTKENHRKLIRWAGKCSAHVFALAGDKADPRFVNALHIAKLWEKGEASTGEAIKASQKTHAAASQASDEVTKAIGRSVGHAVATAHMADHSVCAALYALKALHHAGKPLSQEREWQNKKLQQLNTQLSDLIKYTMEHKQRIFILE